MVLLYSKSVSLRIGAGPGARWLQSSGTTAPPEPPGSVPVFPPLPEPLEEPPEPLAPPEPLGPLDPPDPPDGFDPPDPPDPLDALDPPEDEPASPVPENFPVQAAPVTSSHESETTVAPGNRPWTREDRLIIGLGSVDSNDVIGSSSWAQLATQDDLGCEERLTRAPVSFALRLGQAEERFGGDARPTQ